MWMGRQGGSGGQAHGLVAQTPASKSIGVRIILLILAILVPLVAFDFYNASQEEKRWISEVSNDLQNSTREAVTKIDDLIDASEELLLGLASTDAVLGNNLFSCTRVLRNIGQRFVKYTNFSVVNADKYIVCSSGSLPKPKDVSTSTNIIEAFETKSFAVSPFKFGVLTGQPVLVFSMPLFNYDKEVVGTVNNGLSLTWLGEYLAGISRVEGQRMLVFDGQGTIMASHPPALHKAGSSIAGLPIFAHSVSRLGTSVQIVDSQGEEILITAERIERIPGGAFVAAMVPLEPVLAETNRVLYFHLGLLLLLAALSLFIGWIGAQALVLKPIARLIDATGKVEAGDLRARSGLDYHAGELGTLAVAYDRMVEALEVRTNALRASEANYRELVESEEQLIHRYLPDTTETFANQALADFMGMAPERLVGLKWIEFVSADEQEVVLGFLHSRTPENPTYVYENMMRDRDGEKRWLRWNNRAFFDDDGNITHFQAVGIDLTDRKEVEQSLEVAMMEARAASVAKSNFLANMSHELRTPLNSIIGFSEMMSASVMGKLPAQYEEYASFITNSGHHLLNIINDILDLSKIEAGMLRLEESELDLHREVSEVVNMTQDQAVKNGNALHNGLRIDDSLRIVGDRMRIKQVLLNLVGNAIKFTHGGTITIDGRLQDGGVVLSICDTGIGMTDEELQEALKPFGQVDSQHLTKRFEGTGLGLPLADKLAAMHGATLDVTSKKGEGTKVVLRFPAERTVTLRAEI